MGDAAAILTALSVVIVALTQLYIAQTARRAATKAGVAVDVAERVEIRVEDVHGEVKAVAEQVLTSNGKTLGALADLAEGRRITADVPETERSQSEQHYADRADADIVKQAADAEGMSGSDVKE